MNCELASGGAEWKPNRHLPVDVVKVIKDHKKNLEMAS